MKNKLPENNSTRLASLDILRGFDLFLLVFFQPVFAALVRQMNLPFLNDILYQFDHEVWEGFRFWDLVMPLFLFMTGASMPFSLSRYIGTTGSYRPVYRRILRRVILLFVFGMIVQGNLLGLDSQHLYLYSNTLQSIAVGYFIAAVIQLAGRDNVTAPSRLLDSDDVFGRFYTGGKFCGTSGQMRLGSFPGRSILE